LVDGTGASGPPKSALVLFAHGSRDPQWAAPLTAVQDRIRRQRPSLAVELAYLDLMQPSLADAVGNLAASGRQRITIAPLFMAEGAHLSRDLAQMVAHLRKRHPDVKFRLLPAIGEVDAVIEAMSTWIAANA
jgi:sirohydrochlorin cobaltochelatase